VLKELSLRKQGLFVVTGPTGSGKTTTLAALIDHINSHMPAHIVTLEGPTRMTSPRACGARYARIPTSSSSASCATPRSSARP
jgi:Tfp pilus assembly ATPase PilU